jgi:hypothetical protein
VNFASSSSRTSQLEADVHECDRVQFSEVEIITVGERMTAHLKDVAASVAA